MDETLIPFKGKTQILQYIPNKPYKWGLKVWTLAELKTGYVLKITNDNLIQRVGSSSRFTALYTYI